MATPLQFLKQKSIMASNPVRTTLYFLLTLFFILTLAGCSTSAESANRPDLKANNSETNKLVSFAPSNTELLYSIGAAEALVATCDQCKFPEEAQKKARVGSFTAANYEKLTSLKPDMSLLVSGQESLSSQLQHHGFKTMVLPNVKLIDIPENLKILGKLSAREKKAGELANGFEQALNQLSEILKDSKRPKLLFCIWINPSMCIGQKSFLNDVITICGADNATAYLEVSYPKLTAEKVIALNPEMVVLPYEAKRDDLISKPPWSSLKAVKSGNILFLPEAKDDFLSRPTLRIISGLHWLAARIHPEKAESLNQWLETNRYLIATGR